MSRTKDKTPFRLLAIFLPLLGLAALFLLPKKDETPRVPVPEKNRPKPGPSPLLAELGRRPDWSELERFQKTISRATFLERLETIYTKHDVWRKWIAVDAEKEKATVNSFALKFAAEDQKPPGAIYPWKRRSDLDPERPLPLTGLKIALDPGHIGGNYAALEGREHRWSDIIIREGSMTLATAQVLAPMLEKLGASVTLLRSKLEPVTKDRAKDFLDPRLFYRTSEIRERARLVNDLIQPDLVICLHFNGSSSSNLESRQHFHIILNGTYTATELSHEDERFEMLQRLLSGTITEEIPLAREIAATFNEQIGLPAYRYFALSKTSQMVANHPNLWARNLLANRLYQCPVIFMEPYVMNSRPFVERFKKDPSKIYHEYAQAVADGLARYYSQS